MISACDTPPVPQSGLTISGEASSDTWGDVALVVTIETNESALVAAVNVYALPNYETCPPTVQADPTALSAWTVDLPAGQILVIDGATEEVRVYRKAEKLWESGDRYVSSGQRWSDLPVWPTIPGPCDSVCVVVDADSAADDPDVTVEAVLREA